MPLRHDAKENSPKKVLETTRIFRDFLKMARSGKEPRIVMAGLNPHCEPIFGDEEVRCIQPAIDEARTRLRLMDGWMDLPRERLHTASGVAADERAELALASV